MGARNRRWTDRGTESDDDVPVGEDGVLDLADLEECALLDVAWLTEKSCSSALTRLAICFISLLSLLIPLLSVLVTPVCPTSWMEMAGLDVEEWMGRMLLSTPNSFPLKIWCRRFFISKGLRFIKLSEASSPEQFRLRASSVAITWMISPIRSLSISTKRLGCALTYMARYTTISCVRTAMLMSCPLAS